MTQASPAAFDPVAWWARADGSRTAVVLAESGARISYLALDALAWRWASRLRSSVRIGDRIGVLAHDRVETVALFYACVRLGAVLVPLNWRLTAPELARVLADAAPVVLLGDDGTRDLAERALALVDAPAVPRWIDLDRAALPTDAGQVHASAPEPDEASMLLYTSGSTGEARGAVVPHRQVLWNAIATTTGWQLGSGDVGFAATPLFHTSGWHVFTTTLFSRGGAVVLARRWEAHAFVDTLARHEVSVAFGVPTQFAQAAAAGDWGRSLPRLRWFVAGGAPCPPHVHEAARGAGYALREAYGLTECGPNCFATTDADARAQPDAVGSPVPFLEARLTDPEGCEVGDCHVGELELRGPQLFAGYHGAPAATAAVMTADGWLRTGDLATRDVAGAYRIRGRRKEMYISGGENVFPGEVEAALLACPGVADAVVVAVPHATWGEVGCAMIVRADATLSADRIAAHARARLAVYKVPARVVFVDAIPRLGTGKVDRRRAATLLDTLTEAPA